ncbi:MAG: hypothetical protein DRI57_12265 [Deltaproteobacteria bacterium]|nr:MAG: hypothetical protein DRI57_12265 [Deltaproteobacteria bacterium]
MTDIFKVMRQRRTWFLMLCVTGNSSESQGKIGRLHGFGLPQTDIDFHVMRDRQVFRRLQGKIGRFHGFDCAIFGI